MQEADAAGAADAVIDGGAVPHDDGGGGRTAARRRRQPRRRWGGTASAALATGAECTTTLGAVVAVRGWARVVATLAEAQTQQRQRGCRRRREQHRGGRVSDGEGIKIVPRLGTDVR